ncbi:MAG TPA: twin-arginine translocase TatA/TatE family subunit [Rubrobacteraceae bacterium]|nr:twin-arginine translocase TatA/TatE family subunit [Rubrobacteraceae bacterium]
MFGSLGPTELIIALVIILLLFGAKKVPELARGLGSGVKEFRAGTREGEVKDKEKEKDEELAAAESKTDKTGEAHDPHLEEDAERPRDVTAEADRAEQKQR